MAQLLLYDKVGALKHLHCVNLRFEVVVLWRPCQKVGLYVVSGNYVLGIWWRIGQTVCPLMVVIKCIGQQLNNCGQHWAQTWSMEFCRRRRMMRNIVMWSRSLASSVRLTWSPRRRDLSPGSCKCTPRSSWTIPVSYKNPLSRVKTDNRRTWCSPLLHVKTFLGLS